MKEVKNHYNSFVPILFKAEAVTIGTHIFYEMSSPSIFLRRHEEKHVAQYLKHGFVAFLFRYVLEYVLYRLRGMNHREAYLNISFEKEARDAEKGDKIYYG